jgi:hypothetical protein
MPRVVFEPAIPESKRPQTYVLDSAATGIGLLANCSPQTGTERSCLLAYYIPQIGTKCSIS